MALNPEYTSQLNRPLPFSVGWVKAQGTLIQSMTGYDGSRLVQYVLAEGEWDSCWGISFGSDNDITVGLINGTFPVGVLNDPFLPYYKFHAFPNAPATYLNFLHFHAGQYMPIGIPANLIGDGPDQGTDNWLTYFPSITPPIAMSGFVHFFMRIIPTAQIPTLSPVGIFRSLKCRIFDATGEVIGYKFTTNPTWQMMEALLRYRIKPRQAPLMGLTAAEQACFDFPAMVAHAQRNAFQLPNGKPRFAGNFAFAADAKLGAMMETMLRNCRSYMRERGGQIAFLGDDARASVFTMSRRHVVPGSLKLEKKDLSQAPNIYIPQYRDCDIPAIAQVASVAVVSSSITTTTFTTVGPQPFYSLDNFCYGGGNNDAQLAGNWAVAGYYVNVANVATLSAPPIVNQFNCTDIAASLAVGTNAIGGYVGTQQSRFAQRSPTTVQHRAHQRATGSIGPSIPAVPAPVPVVYDLGNNTFDQTNRIMQFLCARELGPDGPGWIAPYTGSVSLFFNGVDAAGNPAIAIEPGDVLTIDELASPEFTGQYEVTDSITVTAPWRDSAGRLDLALRTYYPLAATDISTTPSNSYQTVPGQSLDMTDFDLIGAAGHIPFWLLQATPTGGVAAGGGSVSLGIPDCSIQWMGDSAPTAYVVPPLTGIPLNQHLILYLNITDKGTTPTLTIDTTAAAPPLILPYGQVVIYCGQLTPASAGSLDSTSTGVANPSGNSGLSAATFTPTAPLLQPDPTTDFDGTTTGPRLAQQSS